MTGNNMMSYEKAKDILVAYRRRVRQRPIFDALDKAIETLSIKVLDTKEPVYEPSREATQNEENDIKAIEDRTKE